MNGSDSLLDPVPEQVVGASFQLVRRGYDPLEVQAFARAVSAELQRLSLENEALRAELRTAQVTPAVEIDESSVAQYLGSETTRLLQAARDTAAGIVHRAEERSELLLATSEGDARRIRDQAVADAAHERRVAADEARKLIADANDQRRNVLSELARRRDTASSQVRELMRGRDVLIQALANVSGSANDLLARLDKINIAPGDFVNLDPASPDADPGTDRGAVLKVDFAPPPPPPGRSMRSIAGPNEVDRPAGAEGSGFDDDGDDGDHVYVLES